MTARFALALFATITLVASATAADKDTAALDGNYTVKSMSVGGKAVPEAVLAGIESATIADGTLTIKIGEKSTVATIKADAAKKAIDFTPKSDDSKAATHPGVYSVDGTELTIVYDAAGTRPKNFDGTGEKMTKLVLSKKK